jgi:hypothetical protein
VIVRRACHSRGMIVRAVVASAAMIDRHAVVDSIAMIAPLGRLARVDSAATIVRRVRRSRVMIVRAVVASAVTIDRHVRRVKEGSHVRIVRHVHHVQVASAAMIVRRGRAVVDSAVPVAMVRRAGVASRVIAASAPIGVAVISLSAQNACETPAARRVPRTEYRE